MSKHINTPQDIRSLFSNDAIAYLGERKAQAVARMLFDSPSSRRRLQNMINNSEGAQNPIIDIASSSGTGDQFNRGKPAGAGYEKDGRAIIRIDSDGNGKYGKTYPWINNDGSTLAVAIAREAGIFEQKHRVNINPSISQEIKTRMINEGLQTRAQAEAEVEILKKIPVANGSNELERISSLMADSNDPTRPVVDGVINEIENSRIPSNLNDAYYEKLGRAYTNSDGGLDNKKGILRDIVLSQSMNYFDDIREMSNKIKHDTQNNESVKSIYDNIYNLPTDINPISKIDRDRTIVNDNGEHGYSIELRDTLNRRIGTLSITDSDSEKGVKEFKFTSRNGKVIVAYGDPETGYFSRISASTKNTTTIYDFDKLEPTPGQYPGVNHVTELDFSKFTQDNTIKRTDYSVEDGELKEGETTTIDLSSSINDFGNIFAASMLDPSLWAANLASGAWYDLFREAIAKVYDPLTLDLDGDGIETLASNGHKGALFDHSNDGIRTATGWVSKDDGFLVYDRNGDGVVNNGGELFGDNTLLKNGERATNGYQALADLDDNGDGKVDAADSAFAKLRVWRDLNQDGISQEGELLTLNEAKVKALNLANKNTDRDLGNGNSLAEEGTYTDSDGNEKQMGDLNLAADPFHSRFSDSVPLTDEQQQAPNLRGSGRVRDLREAAAQSPDVAAALQAYANAQTKEEQLALRDQLLRAWAGTDKRFTTEGVLKAASKNFVMASNGKGNAIPLTPSELNALGTIEGPDVWTLLGIEDPEKKKKAALREKIAILDAFTGTDSTHLYYGTKAQAQHTLDTIEKTYANLADNLYDGLLFQTRLKPYLNAIRFGMNEEGKLQLDYSGVAALFDEVHAQNPGKAFTDLGELLAKGNADGKNTDMAPLAEKFVQYVQEASGNGTFGVYSKVLGNKAFTALGHSFGTERSDYIYSNDSANYIYGNDGDDQIYADGGDDIVDGGAGNDLVAGGHGNDRLSGGAGDDRVYGGEGDDWIDGGDGNDSLAGAEGNDELHGGKGDDSVNGGVGDDQLHGGEGNDALNGGLGHDRLDGGAGDDTLRGGDNGSDTYVFQLGHGQDTIIDMATIDANGDTLRFEGAKSADAYFNREGVDLLVSAYGSNNDQVRISNYFYTEHYRHYSFQFDDQQLNSADIAKKEFEFSGSDKDDRIGAWVTGDTIHGLGGNDNIVGNVGNDKLFGDQGDDYLAGREGNDELDGGSGNDTLNGESGDEAMTFCTATKATTTSTAEPDMTRLMVALVMTIWKVVLLKAIPTSSVPVMAKIPSKTTVTTTNRRTRCALRVRRQRKQPLHVKAMTLSSRLMAAMTG